MLENGGESIAIGFTDKKLSPHAGSAVFWKFLHPSGFIGKLKELLPHRLPESNNAIQLDEDFALPKLILSKFWATEAALSLAVISYNLVVLFQQKLGWQHERITAKTLRYWMFVTAGSLVSHARKRVLQLAVASGQRDWWRRVWEKIACPYPNCNAVGHAAPPSGI